LTIGKDYRDGMKSTGLITAYPNPLPTYDYARLGTTTLTWTSNGTEVVEVRVGAPDGPLFSRSGPTGSATTGAWVADGMVFHLQNVSGGLPLSAANTLATVTVHSAPNRFLANLPAASPHNIKLYLPVVSAPARALVAGWFSFEQAGATAGDLLACDVACEWLAQAGYSYDVALAAPFRGGVDWRAVAPEKYSLVLFVCGPFTKGELVTPFLQRFAECRLIGLSLSMLEPLEIWNPFDRLWERDSSRTAHADIVFRARQSLVPVIGVILVEPDGAKDPAVLQSINDAIRRLLATREASLVEVDTRLDAANVTNMRSSAEIESIIARMDAVVTTRLHGMVLALKHGVPSLVIDTGVDGGKVRRQAETIGWPVVFTANSLADEALQQALDYCLTEDARQKAKACGERAIKMVKRIESEFIKTLATESPAYAASEVLGVWDYQHFDKFNYGDDTSYKKGIAFLDGHGTIEDWGCGFAHAKTFVEKSSYIGIDGSAINFADKIADLRGYVSETDCIFMRHVLEHNYDWRRILANAVASFKKRMVLIIFTPLTETTRQIATSRILTSSPVPDISFRKGDLTDLFKHCQYTEEALATDTQYKTEHIFYIEK
jgi:hypothetical protein